MSYSWAGSVLSTVGRAADYLTPGAGTNRVTKAGRAIKDPNVTWQPSGGDPGFWSGMSFQPAAPAGGRGQVANESAQTHGTSTPTGQYTGGSGTSAANAAAERAQYEDQINYINQLLGNVNTQKDAGLGRLTASSAAARNRLTDQQTKDMNRYEEQVVKNAQQKQRGVEQVDDFANNSYNSLQAILRGANAGGGSVARQLVPQLISKSAGKRREGVFDTAGENEAAIIDARKDAEDQYRYAFEDHDNQERQQREDFLRGVTNQELDLLNKRQALEAQRAAASGGGYAAARAASAGTRAEVDARMAQLNSLFGQFAPTFNARAMNLKSPELSQYQIDPAQIRADQSLPAETRAYLPQLKKKQEERF